MEPTRRLLLAAALPLAALPLAALPLAARAEAWPASPVRLLTGFAPGGPMDIVGRLMAGWLGGPLGQPVLVENRPGAGGNLATEAVAQAAPDGHVLLLCGPVNAINMALYPQLPFDFGRDIAPVAGIARVPLVMLVHPGVPAATAAELIALARTRPAQLAMASSGNGTPQHLAGALFQQASGAALLHVPYRGSGPALADLVAGRVQVMFDALPSAIGHVRGGRLRALAVTTAEPAGALPELPTLAATLPGYEASSWYAIGAPRGTPAETVARLNQAVGAGLADPGVAARLAELGATPMPLPPAGLGDLFAAELARWGRVIREARITLD